MCFDVLGLEASLVGLRDGISFLIVYVRKRLRLNSAEGLAHLRALVRINSAPFELVEVHTGIIIFNFHVDIWAFGAR